MKKLMIFFSVLLLMCGIGLFLIAGKAQEMTKPNIISTGYVSNGQYTQTNSGYIGGNPSGYKSMESLKGIGVVCMIGGLVAAVFSFVIKK